MHSGQLGSTSDKQFLSSSDNMDIKHTAEEVNAELKALSPVMADKSLMIIDTDCGIDDALALMLALSHQNTWKIMAITCVNGNVELEKVHQNVLRVLNVCKQTQIPVFKGCDKPLVPVPNPQNAHTHHSVDGFGGVSSKYPLPEEASEMSEDHASVVMVDMVQKHQYEVTLVAIGPLTNLAIAQRLDPSFLKNLRQLIIMGGNIHALGNDFPVAEFNFATDPEAANLVVTETECPIKIVPWEVCKQHIVDWKWFERWLEFDTDKGKLVKALYTSVMTRLRNDLQMPGFHCCDLLAMAAAINPNTVKKIQKWPAWVELHGESTRGMMVVDKRHRSRWTRKANAEILIEFNMDILKDMYVLMLH